MTQPNWQTRFDELIDNEWWTIDDPDARSMTRTTSKIKHFLATALEEQRAEYVRRVNGLTAYYQKESKNPETDYLKKSDVIKILTTKEDDSTPPVEIKEGKL